MEQSATSSFLAQLHFCTKLECPASPSVCYVPTYLTAKTVCVCSVWSWKVAPQFSCSVDVFMAESVSYGVSDRVSEERKTEYEIFQLSDIPVFMYDFCICSVKVFGDFCCISRLIQHWWKEGEENLKEDEFPSTIHLFCVTLGMQSSHELSSWLFRVIRNGTNHWKMLLYILDD